MQAALRLRIADSGCLPKQKPLPVALLCGTFSIFGFILIKSSSGKESALQVRLVAAYGFHRIIGRAEHPHRRRYHGLVEDPRGVIHIQIINAQALAGCYARHRAEAKA